MEPMGKGVLGLGLVSRGRSDIRQLIQEEVGRAAHLKASPRSLHWPQG